jgi:hypothetical protein
LQLTARESKCGWVFPQKQNERSSAGGRAAFEAQAKEALPSTVPNIRRNFTNIRRITDLRGENMQWREQFNAWKSQRNEKKKERKNECEKLSQQKN